MRDDYEYDMIRSFQAGWNRNMRKTRVVCVIISIGLVVMGIILSVNPTGTVSVVKGIAGIALVAWGVYQIISFMISSAYFQEPFALVMGMMNILLGWLLWRSPAVVTINALSFIVAIMILFTGASKISAAKRLKFFGARNTGVLCASGIFMIISSIVFFIAPTYFTAILKYVMSFYLIINGVGLFIETLSMKELKI